ncbi:uncharacterized protein [Diadema setosum]|uniref:uncharacterized protein n=1 Tax=Diadema setosum TaxID=31175 RepID=UPI003B3A32E7
MASKRDAHDHIRVKDEAFRYMGKEAEELENVFSTNRILLLHGPPFIGKTRTCKEVVLRAARIFRRQDCETHTFYLDIRTGFTVNDVVKEVIYALQEYVQGWSDVKSDGIHVHDLARRFRAHQNGKNRAYIFAMDNIDRVMKEEQGKVLKFVRELVSGTDCVFMVLVSRTSMNLIRDIHCVKRHPHRAMSPADAKALLKEASGNPQDFDHHADRIIELVCRSPLPIMMAGYQMNSRGFQLPFTPQEFVEVMEDSVSRTLGLENVPAEDQIPETIKAIVTENYHILEKIVSSVNDPESFDASELYATMEDSPGHVKQLILHVLLKDSVYMVADNDGAGMQNGLDASPLVFAVLKEFFCQMSSKDIFLKSFNEDVIKALDNQADELLTSRAGALRHAEWDLLKKQRQGCSHGDLSILWRNIITIGGDLVKEVTGDETKAVHFHAASTRKMMSLQSGKNASSTTETHKTGIQESGHTPVLLPGQYSTDPFNFKQNGESRIMEPEACLSPDSSSSEEPPIEKNKTNDMVQREVGSDTVGKTDILREGSSDMSGKQDSDLSRNSEEQQLINDDSSTTDTSATSPCPPLPNEQSPVQETGNKCQCSKIKEISKVVTNSKTKKCQNENIVASCEASKEYQIATTANSLDQVKEQPLRSCPSDDGSVFKTLISVDESNPFPNTDLQDQDKCASSGPSDIFLENGQESFDTSSSAHGDTVCNGKPQFRSLHSTDQYHPVQQSTEDVFSDKTYSTMSTSPMIRSHAVQQDQKCGQFMEMHSVKKAVECVFDWKSCENGHHDNSRLEHVENGGLKKQSTTVDLKSQYQSFQVENPLGFRQSGKLALVEGTPSVQPTHPPLMKHESLWDTMQHSSVRNQIPQYGTDVHVGLPQPPPIPPGTPIVRGTPSQGSCQYAIHPLTTTGFQMPQGRHGYEQQYLNSRDQHHRQVMPTHYYHQNNQGMPTHHYHQNNQGMPTHYNHQENQGVYNNQQLPYQPMPTTPSYPSVLNLPQQYVKHPHYPFLQARHPHNPNFQDQAKWQMSNQQTQASYNQHQFGNW